MTHTTIKIKKNIKQVKDMTHFRFSMVSCGECDDLEESYYNEFTSEYPTDEYETFLIAKYVSNYGKELLKKYDEAIVFPSLNTRVLVILKAFTYGMFKNIRQLKFFKLSTLEEEIDKIPAIRKIINTAVKKEGYAAVAPTLVSSIPEYVDILKKALVKYVAALDEYIKEKSKVKLNKSYYMANVDRFFKLAGIKNSRIKALVEYMLLHQDVRFHNTFPSDAYSNGHADIIATGKKIKVEEINAYGELIFTNLKNARNFKSKTEKYLLSEFLYQTLFTPYINDKEFAEHCAPAIKPTELTSVDFTYIKQVPYLKAILKNAITNREKGINILLYGLPGTGKTALAKVLIQDIKANGSEVPGFKTLEYTNFVRGSDKELSALNNNATRIDNFFLLRRVLKTNKNSVLLYDEAEDFFRTNSDIAQTKSIINEVLEENDTPTIWTMNTIGCLEESFLRRFTYVLNIDSLPQDIYLGMVKKFVKKYNVELEEATLNIYAQYKPSLGLIDKTLKNYVLSKIQDQSFLRADIMDALKGQAYGNELPPVVSNKFNFNPDLLNTSIDLKELTKQIKENKRLDFSLLLYGVPGSSKTSFGRYLAQELGLKVVNKNYSELASCYVGETEHNISKLFKEAEKDKACIILDEADVLLRDRTNSKYSWEVSQTEALLTCMENYPYPFIMTTNLFENLDAAVMRRVLYKVKHDYLTPEQLKIAFKYFFDIDITGELHLSKLASGDFAVVKKQAEYQGKMKDKDWIIEQLTNEMNQKKQSLASPNITL